MSRNYKTGVVRCEVCGEVLGNYKTDDYFKLIRLKYCPACKEEVNRNMKRQAAKKYRKRQREYHSEIEARADILAAENKALRLKLFGTDNIQEAKKLQDILLSLAHAGG